MTKERKLRILVVEDDDLKQQQIREGLSDFIPYDYVDNAEEALERIEVDFPDVVVLDLSIYEKKRIGEEDRSYDRDFGMRVFHEITNINAKQKARIQVILVTANAKDVAVRGFAKDSSSILGIVDKEEGYIKKLHSLVEKAIDRAGQEVVLKNEVFDFPLMKELEEKDKKLYKILNDNVLKLYSKDDSHSLGAIIAARAFLKVLHRKFHRESFDEQQAYKIHISVANEKAAEDWKGLFTINVIEWPQYLCADCLIKMRNHFKLLHENEKAKGSLSTSYDAATAIQLLVPIVKRYIELKKEFNS